MLRSTGQIFNVCKKFLFGLKRNTHLFPMRMISCGLNLSDWKRNNTPRKPEIFKIPKTYTVLEDELVDMEISDVQPDKVDENLCQDVYSAVNEKISRNASRYFAIIFINGKQFKITTDDLIMLKTPMYGTNIGDRIQIEKVLLVGSHDFTLIGRPLLPKSQVFVEAQVIEKTLEHPKLWFQFHRRRRHQKMRGKLCVLSMNEFASLPGQSMRSSNYRPSSFSHES